MADKLDLSLFYKEMAEEYLRKILSMKRLEERFEECEPSFIPEMTDRPSHFFTLVNRVNLERLDESEMELLEGMYQGRVEGAEAAALLEQTCFRVMAGDPESGVVHEYFQDIHGKGILPGNAMVFLFHDKATIDESGRIDTEAELKKIRIFANVKRQFESLAEEKTGVPVCIVR